MLWSTRIGARGSNRWTEAPRREKTTTYKRILTQKQIAPPTRTCLRDICPPSVQIVRRSRYGRGQRASILYDRPGARNRKIAVYKKEVTKEGRKAATLMTRVQATGTISPSYCVWPKLEEKQNASWRGERLGNANRRKLCTQTSIEPYVPTL